MAAARAHTRIDIGLKCAYLMATVALKNQDFDLIWKRGEQNIEKDSVDEIIYV